MYAAAVFSFREKYGKKAKKKWLDLHEQKWKEDLEFEKRQRQRDVERFRWAHDDLRHPVFCRHERPLPDDFSEGVLAEQEPETISLPDPSRTEDAMPLEGPPDVRRLATPARLARRGGGVEESERDHERRNRDFFREDLQEWV